MSSRLPGMYAAYAAAAGLSSGGGYPGGRSAAGSLAAALAAAAGGRGGASIEDEEDVKPAAGAADDGNAVAGPSTGGGAGASTATATASSSKTGKLSRRRSARLNGNAAEGEATGEDGAPVAGSSTGDGAVAAGGEEEGVVAGAVPSSSVDGGEAPRSGAPVPNEGDMDMGDEFDDDEGMYSDEFDDEVGSVLLLLCPLRRVSTLISSSRPVFSSSRCSTATWRMLFHHHQPRRRLISRLLQVRFLLPLISRVASRSVSTDFASSSSLL